MMKRQQGAPLTFAEVSHKWGKATSVTYISPEEHRELNRNEGPRKAGGQTLDAGRRLQRPVAHLEFYVLSGWGRS